jgi:DNA-binding HxlR family transcriptional regulator
MATFLAVTSAPALPGRPCAIASSLALVGEKWSLLAVREIALGNHRFDAIARNTGAPRDRLASRLRALEAAGVVERRQYSERPPRWEYHLTEAGRELRLVLQALRAWGDRWVVDAPPSTVVHRTCGAELDLVMTCRDCGEQVTGDDLRVTAAAPGWGVAGPLPA